MLNTCKSNGAFGLSGGRVSNMQVTCLILGDNVGKLTLIPHKCMTEMLCIKGVIWYKMGLHRISLLVG
jgi:hypothetical protein